MIYLKKVWKNQIFPFFLPKPMLTTCLCWHISKICAKIFQNWVYLCFWKVLKLKVTKGKLIISKGLEMADDLPASRGGRHPLPLLGLMKFIDLLVKIAILRAFLYFSKRFTSCISPWIKCSIWTVMIDANLLKKIKK